VCLARFKPAGVHPASQGRATPPQSRKQYHRQGAHRRLNLCAPVQPYPVPLTSPGAYGNRAPGSLLTVEVGTARS
jgi:hypothetical protein